MNDLSSNTRKQGGMRKVTRIVNVKMMMPVVYVMKNATNAVLCVSVSPNI